MRQNAIRLARLAKGASNLLLHFDHAQNPFGLLLVNGMVILSRIGGGVEASSKLLAKEEKDHGKGAKDLDRRV